MDRCPKCDRLVGDGLGVHYNSDVVRDGHEIIGQLRRQLAAANERAGRLEADNVSLRAGILGHSEYGDYQRARDAWRVRRVGAGSAVQVSSACDTLDAYFGVEVPDAL